MKNIFAPGVRFLNHLNYPRKFGLIGLLLMLPFGLVAFFWNSEVRDRIAFTAQEQLGNEYLRLAQQFTSDLREQRGLTWARLDRQSTPAELSRIEERLQRDIQDLEAADRKLGAILHTTPLWSAIKHKFKSLPSTQNTADPADPVNRHTELIANVRALMNQAGDQSNLILDPELDSYYMMDLLVNRLPLLTDQIGQARGLSCGLAGRETTDASDMFRLRNLISEITSLHETLKHHFEVAFRETSDANLFKELEPAMQLSLAATNRFLELNADPTDPSLGVRASSDELWQRGSETLAEYENLYSLTSVALDRLLQTRIHDLKGRRLLVTVVTFASGLVVVYLFVAFYLAVMRTVAQLDAASVRLLGGQSDDVSVQIDTHDELGQITRSFGALAARLKIESASLRNSEQRMRAILDGATDAVITIDEQGHIESANPKAEQVFGYLHDELIGKNVNLLMPEPYRTEHEGHLKRYLETGEKHIIGIGREVVVLRRDGTTFHADLSVS